MKKLILQAMLFGIFVMALPAAELDELNARRDALLAPAVLAEIGAADPLLGEWLAAQKRILANLEQAVRSDAEQAGSMKADYEYLLDRLAGEIEHAKTVPAIDESKVFNVKVFGAKGDGSSDDGEAIRKAIAAASADTTGRRTVFLPRGRYLVRCIGPESGNLKLDKLRNLRIAGERGTEILLPGPLDVAVRILDCDNVGLKNIAFTYLKPPYTTGRIVGFPADDVMRIEIDPGMAAPTDPMFRQAQTKGLMRFYTPEVIPGSLRPFLSSVAPHQGAPEVTKVDDRTYDFKVNSFTPVSKHYAKGSHVAFYARTYGNHAVNNANSTRTRLENLTLNTSSAMAVLNNASDRPFVVNCRIEALPGSFVSTSADGIYMRNISLGGLVRGNIVRHVGDDFMNIHSYVFPAVKAEGKTLYVKAKDWNLRNFAPGRRLGLLRTSAGQNGIAKEVRITAIEPEGELLKVTLDGGFGRIVTLEDTKGMPDMLILPDNQNHGMVVTGNRFEDGVSRFLAGGRNWLFTDNTVVDSLHHSYFMNLCPETVGRNGFEFVTPRNVELAGNRFETAAKTLFRFGSSANAEREADHSIPSASHIRVADNDIEITGSSNLPLIRINGVEFLTFTGNRISAAAPQGGPLFEREGGRELELGGNFVTGNLKR